MKPIYFAKENGGSIIEVRRHGRDWETLDGRCIYQRGSFEWYALRSKFDAVIRSESK